MNVCIVNGKRYNIPSGNINVINGKVYCNGKPVIDTNDFTEKNIKIIIQGNVDGDVKTDCGDIEVTGNCRSVISTSGDITIKGSVSGGVKSTSGDITCDEIRGDVQTVSGDIENKAKGFFKRIFID